MLHMASAARALLVLERQDDPVLFLDTLRDMHRLDPLDDEVWGRARVLRMYRHLRYGLLTVQILDERGRLLAVRNRPLTRPR